MSGNLIFTDHPGMAVAHRDGVLDLVGEVFDGAARVALLGRVLRRRVRLGHVRQDNLDVALRAERARLEKRLLVVDAALVHVLACKKAPEERSVRPSLPISSEDPVETHGQRRCRARW